ncbi:hypothetical protein B0H14DRAFT_1605114 [Mycena olivaceomarginata]|nr:hypothetical protein B0H14DRAFT_1605114 [Mycena olivaceomarginata]
MKRQLAFLLACAQTPIEWLRAPSDNPDEEIDIEDEFPEDLRECLSHTRMSGHFRDVGKELGVTDPKSLEDVYKTHLENTRPNALADVDSARGNLAGTFVNMHYGEPVIRKSVPLAIGLVSVPNSQLPILDTLSKYSHDNDLAVHYLCDGARWCGNQKRAAGTDATTACGVLLQEPDCLFMVRIAQGLVHMGKGTIGLNPFFSDRSIMSRPVGQQSLASWRR